MLDAKERAASDRLLMAETVTHRAQVRAARRATWRRPLAVTALILISAAVALSVPDSPVRIRLLEALPDPLLTRVSRVPLGDPWPLVILGERLLARGKPRSALDRFNQAESLGCHDLRWAAGTVDALRAGGLYAGTDARTQELLQMNPRSGRLYRVLGQCQVAQGNLSSGLASLEKAVELAPDDPSAWVALGKARLSQGGYSPQAAQPWIDGHARIPADASLRYGTADVLVGLGRYAEAEALVRRLPQEPVPENPEIRPLFARAWYARGVALHRQDPDTARLAQAQQSLEHALSLDPQLPDAYYELGVLQDEAGQPQQAVHSLERAVQLRPYAHPFWYRLAIAYRHLGREREADRAEARFSFLVRSGTMVQQLSERLQEHPNDFATHLDLARILLQRQEWDAAARHTAAVLSAQPGNSEAQHLWKQLQSSAGGTRDRRTGA